MKTVIHTCEDITVEEEEEAGREGGGGAEEGKRGGRKVGIGETFSVLGRDPLVVLWTRHVIWGTDLGCAPGLLCMRSPVLM